MMPRRSWINERVRSSIFAIPLRTARRIFRGAHHLHDGNVHEFLQKTEKDEAIVVYCYHGNSSLGATAFLIDNGFKDVASMSGGFEAWRQVYEHEAG